MSQLKQRERDAIMQALRAGVVPKLGLRHLQVGRAGEIEALIQDIEHIGDGGAAIRFVIGEYGSGKTFFLNLMRWVALEKGMVTMFADLAPDRRIHASAGQARGLYAEMAKNLSTRSKPDGGGLVSVVERFIAQAHQAAQSQGCAVDEVIKSRLAHFQALTGGFEFAEVIRLYWQAHETADETLSLAVLRWLRGEYATRTDARKALGVRTIIDDANIYDQLKLMSAFVRAAGYRGLLVGLDEMVNVYKLASAQARQANYEQILRIVNDVLQGSATHIGFLMAGTPEFLTNTRRGLYSYEALQTRLAENGFAQNGLVDLTGPVLRLANLTPEDLFVLLSNIRAVAPGGEELLPDDALTSFMAHCSTRIGEAYFRTPRNTVTAFVNLLSVLQQNPQVKWQDLIEQVEVASDQGEDLSDLPAKPERSSHQSLDNSSDHPDDQLSSFKL